MGFVNWGSFAIQFLNLLVVIYVLNRFLWKPFLAYLDEEGNRRSELESAHAEMSAEKDAASAEVKSILADARKDAKEIREGAKTLAKQESSLIVFEANKEADALRAKASSDIVNERRALEESMKEKIVSVALKINEKMFAKSPANAEFVRTVAKDLS